MSKLYELPDGWEWKKLGDLAEYINGMAFKPTDWAESGFPIIRIQNLNGSDDYNYFNGEAKERYYVKDGDILISWSASLDVYKWNGGNAILNQHIFNTDIKLDVVDYDFFYHTIKYSLSEIMKNLHGVGMKHITKSKFENINVHLPPLPEQQRIVSKLDLLFEKIDRSIALHQKNMDEANAFMGSVLNDVFGELEEKYPLKSIGSFSKVGTGVTPLKGRNDFYENGTINWITSKATNNDYVYESEQLITEIALNECRLKTNPIGTIVVALYGQGKTRGQVSELMIQTATNQALATILVDKKQSVNKYLKYFLKKSYIDIREKASGGTQPNLNLTIIKNIELPLPPLQTQQKIVTYLDEISQKIEIMKRVQNDKMDSLKALKASILDSAFRGEL